MTGPEALKALIEGQSVRVKFWTPSNRLWREWNDELETHTIKFEGTELFHYDMECGDAVWLVEHFADNDDIWEIHKW